MQKIIMQWPKNQQKDRVFEILRAALLGYAGKQNILRDFKGISSIGMFRWP